MKTLASTAAAVTLLLGSTALAGPIDDIVSQFQSYGYQSIEICQSGNLVRIEGVRDGTEREIVYDLTTSTIVSDHTGDNDDNGGTDVEDDEEDEDEEDDHEEDDHEEDDHEDDHEEDDHEEDDHEDDHEDEEDEEDDENDS